MTANEIIKSALRSAGIIRPDQTPRSEDFQTALEVLNILVSEIDAQGFHLWSYEDGVVFLDVGKRSYSLGTDPATNEFINTTLAVDALQNDTTLTLTTTNGVSGAVNTIENPFFAQFWAIGNTAILTFNNDLNIENGAANSFAEYTLTTVAGNIYIVEADFVLGSSADATLEIDGLVSENVTSSQKVSLEFVATQNEHTFRITNGSAVIGEDSTITSLTQIDKYSGDYLGIRLNDVRQWTRVVSVLGDDVVIADPLQADATAGVTVFTFTDLMERPLRISNPRTQTIPNSEFPIELWARQEYFDQTSKDNQGTVTQVYYSPTLVNGGLFVWSTAANVDQVVRFTYVRQLKVTPDLADTVDFPDEWSNYLRWALAEQLIPEYSIEPQKAQLIIRNAKTSFDNATGFDVENNTFKVVPCLR